MHNLSFNWNVLVPDLFLWYLNVFDSLFWDVLRDVLSEIFNGIIVSYSDLLWNVLNFSFFSIFYFFSFFGDSLDGGLILVFNDLLFKGNILNSAFSLNDFFSSINSGSYDLSVSGSYGGGWNTGRGGIVLGGGVVASCGIGSGSIGGVGGRSVGSVGVASVGGVGSISCANGVGRSGC